MILSIMETRRSVFALAMTIAALTHSPEVLDERTTEQSYACISRACEACKAPWNVGYGLTCKALGAKNTAEQENLPGYKTAVATLLTSLLSATALYISYKLLIGTVFSVIKTGIAVALGITLVMYSEGGLAICYKTPFSTMSEAQTSQ